MKQAMFAVAAGVIMVGGAQAQLLNLPPSEARAPALTLSRTQPFPVSYLVNEEAVDMQAGQRPLFKTFRADPKLVAGFDITPYLGLEAGYANLFSRSYHFIDEEARHEERDGAMGQGGFTGYLATRVTLPIDQRLSTYGKFGIAYSERDTRDAKAASVTDADAGLYANVGARYKLSDKASVVGEYQRAGDTRKWGNSSNANGFGAKLKLGF